LGIEKKNIAKAEECEAKSLQLAWDRTHDSVFLEAANNYDYNLTSVRLEGLRFLCRGQPSIIHFQTVENFQLQNNDVIDVVDEMCGD